VQWECQLEEKPELLTQSIVRQTPLCTRDVLYGGRTVAMRLHYKLGETDTLQECKIVEACLRMDGLIMCTTVPPQKLYHPVLPYGCKKKLIFCLCRTCVQTCSTGECKHTEDEERALTGTWVMDELRLAMEKGYRILEIYEVYKYQVTQYNP